MPYQWLKYKTAKPLLHTVYRIKPKTTRKEMIGKRVKFWCDIWQQTVPEAASSHRKCTIANAVHLATDNTSHSLVTADTAHPPNICITGVIIIITKILMTCNHSDINKTRKQHCRPSHNEKTINLLVVWHPWWVPHKHLEVRQITVIGLIWSQWHNSWSDHH